MELPIDKEWFEKRAAAEGDHEIGAGRRKTMTINLTDGEIAELEKLVMPASPHWRCFHCDEVFYDTHSAKLHFGMDQCSDPACKIKMGAEGSLVKALRTAENELSDAWAAIHNESTEAAKAYYAQQSRHGEQLRATEELGYERGLADGRAEHPPHPQAGVSVSELQRLLAVAEEALKPFADEATEFNDEYRVDWQNADDNELIGSQFVDLTFGDFRRARAALSSIRGEKE